MNQYKSRKGEYALRDDAVKAAKIKLDKIEDNLEGLAKKKSWITADQKQDAFEKVNDTREWLEMVVLKQVQIPLSEDPAFKVGDLDTRIKRVETVYARVNAIQKPKSKDNPYGKFGKNIKMDNITFDGNSGDVNWEDFIKINNGPGGNDYEDDEEVYAKGEPTKIEDVDFTSEDL
jgi:hypothetical protein